jgi:hypothetical protein
MTPADAETGSKLGDQAIFVSDIVDRANGPDAKMTVGFARVGNREPLDISFPYDSRGCERLASRASDDRNGRHAVVWVGAKFAPASGEERACSPIEHRRELLGGSAYSSNALDAARSPGLPDGTQLCFWDMGGCSRATRERRFWALRDRRTGSTAKPPRERSPRRVRAAGARRDRRRREPSKPRA